MIRRIQLTTLPRVDKLETKLTTLPRVDKLEAKSEVDHPAEG
jgi:hypothetical protein